MKLLVTLFLIMFATACVQSAQTHYQHELDAADAAAAHAIHNQRLQQLMRGLGRLSDERLPKAMNVDLERDRRVDEIVAISRTMATSAASIPDVTANDSLNEDERRTLTELASALEDQALELSRRAPELSIAELRTSLDRISQTCDACHEQFRLEDEL